MLPHCPMAMNNGIPVAFFVSDPRLWPTNMENSVSVLKHIHKIKK
jgi:hypothetical protein